MASRTYCAALRACRCGCSQNNSNHSSKERIRRDASKSREIPGPVPGCARRHEPCSCAHCTATTKSMSCFTATQASSSHTANARRPVTRCSPALVGVKATSYSTPWSSRRRGVMLLEHPLRDLHAPRRRELERGGVVEVHVPRFVGGQGDRRDPCGPDIERRRALYLHRRTAAPRASLRARCPPRVPPEP